MNARDLKAELVRLTDDGARLVCVVAPAHRRAWWTSDSPIDQDRAAELCRACPALMLCRDYARANPKERGVYGASTEADRRARVKHPPSAKKTCDVCGRAVANLTRHHRLIHERTAA